MIAAAAACFLEVRPSCKRYLQRKYGQHYMLPTTIGASAAGVVAAHQEVWGNRVDLSVNLLGVPRLFGHKLPDPNEPFSHANAFSYLVTD
jgi:hypothetical protein